MKNSSLIIILIFIIAIALFGYLYYKYEIKNEVDEGGFTDFNIYARDLETNKQIQTGFKVYVDGIYKQEGNTSKKGAINIKLPINSSILIYNNNLGNQSYYTNEFLLNNSENETYRVQLNLENPGEIDISHEGKIGDSEPINLSLSSQGIIKNSTLCFSWSRHLIYAKIENYKEVEKLEGQDKCFILGDINQTNMNLFLTNKIFGTLDKSDYINLSFYSTEQIPFNSTLVNRFVDYYKI